MLNNLATMYGAQGDVVHATRFCEESIKLKREAGNMADVANSQINLANYLHRTHRDTEATRALEEAEKTGRETKHTYISVYALEQMGVIQLDNHHPEAALKLFEEGDRLAQEGQPGEEQPAIRS